ncbi:hypothetical protein [Klebsiella pneumoniae IS22]|nr:hypothetical protein [Klebsiella pneumoniae IS22]
MPGGGFALPGLQNSYAAAPDYHFLPRRPARACYDSPLSYFA